LVDFRHWWAPVVLLVLVPLTSCGGSAPVIVSGDVEAGGARVEVTVYSVDPNDPYNWTSHASQHTDGHFELRGEMSASEARSLLVTAEPDGYNFELCDADAKLPPLRLSEGKWVNARSGKAVVLTMKLDEAPDPFADSYEERCPSG
jgi:hypothetical protein